MATAPTPGVTARLQAEMDEQQLYDSGLRVTCGAENKTVEMLLGDLTSTDELAVIRETGMTPASLLNDQQIAHTGVIVWYWLGLRQTNDVRTLTQLLDRYGTRRKFSEAKFDVDGLGPYFDAEGSATGGDESGALTDPTPPAEPSATPGPTGPTSTASTPGTSEDPPS